MLCGCGASCHGCGCGGLSALWVIPWLWVIGYVGVVGGSCRGFVWFLVDLGLLDLCYMGLCLCCGFGFGSCYGVAGFVL